MPRLDEMAGQEVAEWGAFLVRHRRVLLGYPIAAGAMAAVIAVALPRSYTASASFTPQAVGAGANRFGGLAAQLGVTLPGSDGQSPQFYADLAKTDAILAPATDIQVAGRDGRQVPFRRAIGLDEPDSVRGRAGAILWLRDHLAAGANLKSGVVTVSLRTQSPEWSFGIVREIVDRINLFNVHGRQTQARAERVFVEARMGQSKKDLEDAEGRLQAFLQRNRDFGRASTAEFEFKRLERDVARQSDRYGGLLQSYEQSRLNEVRDTPVISIVEAPALPVLPDSRHGLAKVLLGVLGGLSIAATRGRIRDRIARTTMSGQDTVAR